MPADAEHGLLFDIHKKTGWVRQSFSKKVVVFRYWADWSQTR
jgi:hypothetical protein